MDLTWFTPAAKWLLVQQKYEMIDIFIAVAFTALALSQKFWFPYLPISDNIPGHFWYQVPQESLEHSDASEAKAESRNIRHVFSDGALDMVVFWGSQSGRSEMLARQLTKSLHDRFKLKVLTADLGEYDHVHLPELEKHQLCAFVLSTYGDGDPPDNTTGLWDALHKLQAKNTTLDNLNYFIFGLGNSNYRQFNRVAGHVDAILQSMNAVRLGHVGRGDDANGETEDAFLPWKQACETLLKQNLRLSEQVSTYKPSFNVQEDPSASEQVNVGDPNPAMPKQTKQIPAKPILISEIYKLWEDDARMCIHVELDLGEDRMVKYKTGDHLAVWPSNPDIEVNRLISLLNLNEKQHTPMCIEPAAGGMNCGKMPVATPTTVHALLRYYLEICAPLSQETVAELALFAPSDAARAVLGQMTESPKVFKAEILASHATLADILEAAGKDKHWNIPVSFLLERLKPMNPRHYSISSSTVVQPRAVSLTAVVTKPPQEANGVDNVPKGCYGLATSYLSALEKSVNQTTEVTATCYPPRFTLDGPRGVLEGGKLFAQIRQSIFKLPVKTSTPVIMLGAGTGVAPFRAFVQERVRRKELGQQIGKTLLFMGFRHPDVDFIYNQDWMKWRDALGHDMFKFWTAFSRESGDRKMYIQDQLKENSREVMDLLTGSVRSHLYICGSAAMARDVVRTLMAMRMDHSGDDEEQAALWVKQLRQSKQLLEEVWG